MIRSTASPEAPGHWWRGQFEVTYDDEVAALFGRAGVDQKAQGLGSVYVWPRSGLTSYPVPLFAGGALGSVDPVVGRIQSPGVDLANLLAPPSTPRRSAPRKWPGSERAFFEHWQSCGDCPRCEGLAARTVEYLQEWGPLGLSREPEELEAQGPATRWGQGDFVVEPLGSVLRAAAALAEWVEWYLRWRSRSVDPAYDAEKAEIELLFGPGRHPDLQEEPLAPARSRAAARRLGPFGRPRPSFRGLNRHLSRAGVQVVGGASRGTFQVAYTFPTLLTAIYLQAGFWLARGDTVLSRCARADCGRAFLRVPSRERRYPRMYCSDRCRQVAAHQRVRLRQVESVVQPER
ncbi:MAG: hypothetical protein ACREPI_05165 [Candidatus Dormibacterales bacterium]